MASAPKHSIEEQVEDWCKEQLGLGNYYTKTEEINSEISAAFLKYPSKNGGKGRNYPDIQYIINSPEFGRIPVMIEVKGTKGCFIKVDDNGEIANVTSKGTPNYANISKYAVNGAVHYAQAILKFSHSYDTVIAIGVNGFQNKDKSITREIGVYLLSKFNLFIPKKIADYSDLSFLKKENLFSFFEQISLVQLSQEEIERRKFELEDEIERNLKNMNQRMRGELQIADIDSRVRLLAGMVMAGLGAEDVSPLSLNELRGELGERTNDGVIFMNRIHDFLNAREIPQEKIHMIENELNKAFLYSKLQLPNNGISVLHTLYSDVNDNLLKFLRGDLHNIDFTGKLFNSITEWIRPPEDPDNDVVLTPRYVTELMAKICNVNKDSYVWDFATGSGGFLISAMHLMMQDAKESCKSPQEYKDKISNIKFKQLLGIEKQPSIYLLAVLNMILMGDGSSNLIHADSLEDFEGNYEQGEEKGKPFPADVFLLNPPYSADGKGFIFVAKALRMMTHRGMAAVLIQENAGDGNGLPYTKEILENNTLVASIRMSDIFCGKASVQTAIYVFNVGVPHNVDSLVRFIDFSKDGYTRTNRKKSSQSVNLRDTDNAKARYDEIVKLVRVGKGKNDCNLHYFKDNYVEDYITLDGNDWTYKQHQIIDTAPTYDDFYKVVSDYLSWRVSEVIKSKSEDNLGKQ